MRLYESQICDEKKKTLPKKRNKKGKLFYGGRRGGFFRENSELGKQSIKSNKHWKPLAIVISVHIT